MIRCATLLLAAALPGLSQGFRLGVKGGVPLTHYFDASSGGFPLRFFDSYSAATRRYTVGLTGEWWLGLRLALAADLLYKRMGYVAERQGFGAGRGFETSYDVKGHSWDIPVVAKYRLLRGARPFASGGLVFRYAGPVRALGQRRDYDLIAGTDSRTNVDTSRPDDLTPRRFPGVVFGGGLDLGAGRVAVVPEVRVARWLRNLPGPYLRLAAIQVEVLVGLVF